MTLEEFINRMGNELKLFEQNWKTNQILFGEKEFPNELEDVYEWFEQFEYRTNTLEL